LPVRSVQLNKARVVANLTPHLLRRAPLLFSGAFKFPLPSPHNPFRYSQLMLAGLLRHLDKISESQHDPDSYRNCDLRTSLSLAALLVSLAVAGHGTITAPG